MAQFVTNFHREPTGNSLELGKDLTITASATHEGQPIKPRVMTGKLYKRKFLRKQLIQIEQTGRKSNPQSDSITFEMKDRTGPLPPGKYRVEVKANFYPHKWERGIKDNFKIV